MDLETPRPPEAGAPTFGWAALSLVFDIKPIGVPPVLLTDPGRPVGRRIVVDEWTAPEGVPPLPSPP